MDGCPWARTAEEIPASVGPDFFPTQLRREDSMLRRNIRLTAVATAAFALCLTALSPPRSFAESKGKLEGSWSVRITGGPGTPTLPSWYRALVTFTREGGLAATITDSSISTGHGAWIHTGHHEFAVTIELLQFDASGDFAGTLKAAATLALDKSGTAFTSDDYRFAFFDVDGNPTGFTGVGQATGTRLVVPSTP
jgi:hypothetical protein